MIIRENEILYGKLRPNLNKVLYADINGVCSTDIFVLDGNKNIVQNKFYSYYLRSETFKNEVLYGLVGAQLPRISWAYLSKIKIPLPPLAVQKQFVSEAEKEEEIIAANRRLIEMMEIKIEKVLSDI